jgi:opacity protein-like surface antigen
MLSKLKVLFAVALATVALPAIAADLGKPAAVAAVAPAPIPDQWSGFYLEGGAAGQFVTGGDKRLIGLGGIGYNYHALGNPFVGSLFARYGFSAEGNSDAAVLTFDQPLTIAVRAGYLVQPSTLLYGLAGYSMSLRGDDFRGPILGVGAEAPVLGSLRLGVEYTAQFDRDFKADKDVVHAIGVFARLPF